jgi:hypothetical protein
MWAGIGLDSRLELSTKQFLSRFLAEKELRTSSSWAQNLRQEAAQDEVRRERCTEGSTSVWRVWLRCLETLRIVVGSSGDNEQVLFVAQALSPVLHVLTCPCEEVKPLYLYRRGVWLTTKRRSDYPSKRLSL